MLIEQVNYSNIEWECQPVYNVTPSGQIVNNTVLSISSLRFYNVVAYDRDSHRLIGTYGPFKNMYDFNQFILTNNITTIPYIPSC